ncbi:MAG: VIT domain-containing protein, partial [Planctomycetota bacterium]
MSDRPTEPTPSTGHAGPDDDAGDPRLTDLLAGALPADEAAALHAELAAGLGNPGASGSARAQEFRELQAAWQLFDALPAVTPSASLEQSVLDQIHRLASTSSSTPAGHQPAALRSVSHTDHTRTESTMERSTTSLPSLVTRLAAQLIVPLAAAAMLLLSVTVMFNPPAPHGSPTATSVESLRAGNPTADMTRHAQGGLKGLGAGQPAGQAGPVVLIDNTNDPINPFGAVSAPEPMNPPQASAPIAPEPMNPPSYRYRSMGSDWQTLNSNVALDRLNLEVAVPAGQTTTLTFGTARLTIDGGQHGNVVTLVPDPMAGMGDNGRANGVMIEALDAGRMYLEQSTAVDGIAGTIALRTTTAVASVGTSNVELVNDAAGNTQLSVAKGRIELAGLRADGGVADAVVHEGEVATISLLARPDVRKHLNASWIANWARTAAAQIDTRYENPLVAGASASAGSAAVGSLVSSDPDYADVPFIIDEHKVDVRIVDQMAVTTVEEVFENTTERTMEGVFWFPLPTDAAISQFSMWVRQPDGQT